jgi:hypothetical protein
LFGRPWQIETGLTDETLAHGKPALIYGASFGLSLIAAFVFSVFIGPDPSLALGVGGGLSAGLG